MRENIQLGTKIAGKSALKWIFIFGLGNLITIIIMLIALFSNTDLFGHAAHINSIFPLIAMLFFGNIFAFILIVGVPVFVFLYFTIANKVSIETTIYNLWKSKAGTYITEKIEKIIHNFTNKEGWRNNFSNATMAKAKILQSLKEDKTTSKIQRKIINYGFKKVSLEDVNFQDENLKLSDIIVSKFHDAVSEIAKPSLMLFWVLMGGQIILLIASFLIKS